MPPADGFTAFVGDRRVAHGDLAHVARAAHALAGAQPTVFADATGRVIDLDLRGSADEAVARVSPPAEASKPVRGRPKLGVTAREVTLLPRHWDWLATQAGGASAALRRLVDEARRQSGDADAARQAQEAAYRVMTTLAGDLPAYEEAVRALFARDRKRLAGLTSAWPPDIAAYVGDLASGADVPVSAAGNPRP
jgi:hypothetical protein